MMPWLLNPSNWLNVRSAGLSRVVNEYLPLPGEVMLEVAPDEDVADEAGWRPPELALCPPCGWPELAATLSGPQPVSPAMSPAPTTAMATPPVCRPRLLGRSQRGALPPMSWLLNVMRRSLRMRYGMLGLRPHW
jgi:hypothetical protein